MTRSQKLFLSFEGHVPSKKNSLRRISRVIKGRRQTLSISSEAYEMWEKAELLSVCRGLQKLAADEGLTFPVASPFRIAYRFYPGTLQDFDLSNSIESINDLLIKAGAIEDDCWRCLQQLDVRVAGFDRIRPCVQVDIRSLKPSQFDTTLAQVKSFLADKSALRERARVLGTTQIAIKADLERLLTNSTPSQETHG